MFTERTLPDDLADLRPANVQVLDCEQEFETMPEDWVYELALITDAFDPLEHPAAWIPTDAPAALQRTTASDPAIGMPDDGSVAWTRQTDPAYIFVKPRASSLPGDFRDFLIAEALIEIERDVPETAVGFFRDEYRAMHDIADSPMEGFQLAAALRRGWIGLQTRDTFAAWESTAPRLHAAWVDAGERLRDRVDALPTLVASGELSFADATELACNAIKHDLELPAPFAALDVEAFADQGAPFALAWTTETKSNLDA